MKSAAPPGPRLTPERALKRLHGAAFERYSIGLGGAVLVVILLFSLVERLIVVPPSQPRPGQAPIVDNVQVLDRPPSPRQPQLQLPAMPTVAATKAPPTPPAPPRPAAPSLPSLQQLAPVSAPALEVAPVGVPADIGSGQDLFGSGKFAGFAGVATGGGGGGSGTGYGTAADFKGKTLIPLSTARPEIPKWAYEHRIEGWVEVAFTVNTEGHVENIRIVDAQPKGVFENAAVSSIAHWIYPQQKHPIEVKQRVEFRLQDYQYNWNTN